MKRIAARIASEPLVHFALLGALVFAGHRAITSRVDVRALEVSAAKQRELGKLFEQRQHKAPTDVELRQMVTRYIEDEALFREGLRLSLVQTDPMLRAQLIARVRGLLQAEVSATPPRDEPLQAYYEAHRADYASPETVSYREYLFPTGPSANDDARRLSLTLQRGEEPDGATLPPPAEHARQSNSELVALAGADLARRIWALPAGVWRELASRDGVHVLRVDDHSTASDPPFESVREQVLVEYRKEQTSRAFRSEVARLTSQYRVSVAGEP